MNQGITKVRTPKGWVIVREEEKKEEKEDEKVKPLNKVKGISKGLNTIEEGE